MIRRLIFAALAIASFPAILGAPSAHAQTYPTRLEGWLYTTPHLSVTAVGKGSPVILIPGLSSPRAVWEGVVPELAKTHRVYLVQVNGFGGEDPGDNLKPGILKGLVDDLHEMVAHEKLGEVPVVGHSMGGLTGLLWAKTYPRDVAKLMIVDSLPYIGALFVPGATVEMVEPQARGMRDQMAGLYGSPTPDAVIQSIVRTNALKPESQAQVAIWLKPVDMRVSAQAMYEVMTTDLRGDLAGITAPITLLYPSSTYLPEERANALYRGEYARAPHMTFVNVADSGHFIMLDQPAAFGAALADFLK